MKAIRRFTVRTLLPEPLAPLGELMLNLRWSWHPETREVFAAIDGQAWDAAGHDPARLLGAVDPRRLARLGEDRRFLRLLSDAAEDLREYLTGPRWYQSVRPGQPGGDLPGGLPAAIAYFSPEYGITAALPQYSGGLGILAGDHLKTASDLGVPIVGVGLLYRHGYFTQSLSGEGWQLERYPASDPNGAPLTLLREPDGGVVRIGVALPHGRTLSARIWIAQVGRVPLLLLDSYVDDNDRPLQEITDRLYGGGGDHRLLQELLLGVGGVRAIRAFCRVTGHPAPEVFHTNEGHAGFLGVERMREYVEQGLSFDEALEATRAGTVFTTHTPVPAGIDRFPRELVERHFAVEDAWPGLPVERVLGLGAESYDGGDPAVFNMAVMGMRVAQRVNGVSRLHGEVSRGMFGGLWPGFDPGEVPIGSITNGVHAPTWVAPEIFDLAHRAIGPRLTERGRGWEHVESVADADIWAVRRVLRERLVRQARRRLAASWRQRGASEAELGWTEEALDPDVLTIGFARRVPSYKRLTLMLRDPERLRGLLLHRERPVQIVIAGKAHPADEGGKRLIQEMVRFTDDSSIRHRVVLLPDYDMALAQLLVQGCDVWMNNPLRPLEACGTSGMKSALNGGLNLSIRDGWWEEWYDGGNGFEIPSAEGVGETDRRDDLEAAALYDILEGTVTGLFYDRDGEGLPRRWLEMVKHTLRGLGPKVLATRMLRDYVDDLYLPAAAASRAMTADGFAGARELAAWKERVARHWPGVRIDHVGADPEDGSGEEAAGLAPALGSRLAVRASVVLGELSTDDVTVEVGYGRVDDRDDLVEPAYVPLVPTGRDGAGAVRYTGTVSLDRPGAFGYNVRVLPHHPKLASPAELGLIAAPPAPPGMTNGDLR